MTPEQISRLYYLLGRFEGISHGCHKEAKDAILDTCEWLEELIQEVAGKDELPFLAD